MSEEEKKEGEAAAPAKKGGKKKLFIIIGAVVVLLVGGGVPLFLMGGEKPPAEGDTAPVEEAHEAPKEMKIADMDVFIVNLSENTAFLKVKMAIEYDPEIVAKYGGGGAHGGGEADGGGGSGGGEKNPYEMPQEIKTRLPQMRDQVIRILSSKRAADVLSVEGKDTLKQELIEGLNEAIGYEEAPITNVFFSEFIIQ